MARNVVRPAAAVAIAGLLVALLAAPGLGAATPNAIWNAHGLTGRGHVVHFGSRGEVDVNVCSNVVRAGFAHCDAHLRADLLATNVSPRTGPSANGAAGNAGLGNNGAYDPAYLQSAYNAPSATNGTGQTVAIVDAFDAPNVESDLAFYRTKFSLPACTTANGCFTKVNQRGGTTYPPADAGWAQEISLDVDMVSALCPNCHILLVEADNPSFINLGTAVNRAVALGANVVSNSYGGGEWSGEPQADVTYFNHPGVAIVASTGDFGFGVSYPAASPNVVAVGGTSLQQATNTGTRNATETVWSGAGSGCSQFESKPAWQTDTGCAHRTLADVAAVADPGTGVWVYDGGWGVFGGTSVASPIIGALFGLAGNAPSTGRLSAYPYAHLSALNDVVSGHNGTCGGSYLCNGAVGYDGPTGLGTPNTAAAFTPGGSPPPAPDFSVSAASNAVLLPGGSITRPVTVTARNGFGGNVSLSATVSPNTGLSATLSPATVVSGAVVRTSTLTLSAHIGRVYTVTVTAKQGALVHTKVMTVAVEDFSLKLAPATVTVTRGQATHYTLTVTPIGLFNHPVTLAISGLRVRDTVAFAHNPAAFSSAQSITITTSPIDAPGPLTVHLTGTSGKLSRSAVATLVLK